MQPTTVPSSTRARRTSPPRGRMCATGASSSLRSSSVMLNIRVIHSSSICLKAAALASDRKESIRGQVITQVVFECRQGDLIRVDVCLHAATRSSRANWSSGSVRVALVRFSRRWVTDEAPGMSRIFGERRSNRANVR